MDTVRDRVSPLTIKMQWCPPDVFRMIYQEWCDYEDAYYWQCAYVADPLDYAEYCAVTRDLRACPHLDVVQMRKWTKPWLSAPPERNHRPLDYHWLDIMHIEPYCIDEEVYINHVQYPWICSHVTRLHVSFDLAISPRYPAFPQVRSLMVHVPEQVVRRHSKIAADRVTLQPRWPNVRQLTIVEDLFNTSTIELPFYHFPNLTHLSASKISCDIVGYIYESLFYQLTFLQLDCYTHITLPPIDRCTSLRELQVFGTKFNFQPLIQVCQFSPQLHTLYYYGQVPSGFPRMMQVRTMYTSTFDWLSYLPNVHIFDIWVTETPKHIPRFPTSLTLLRVRDYRTNRCVMRPLNVLANQVPPFPTIEYL